MNNSHHITRPRWLAVALAAAALFALSGAPAGASTDAASSRETHCVVTVVDQLKSGEYLLSDEECFGTFAAAMDAAGLGSSANTPAKATVAASALSSTLAVHFDGANYTGSSFSVVGVDCLGGYVNMSPTWDNRVSSTFGGICPRIRHWTGANTSGTFQDTVSSGNLTTLNNAASSIQYLT